MERKSLSGLGRILAGLAVVGSVAGLSSLGGCQYAPVIHRGKLTTLGKVFDDVWKGPTFPKTTFFGDAIPLPPKEIQNEERLNRNRKLLESENSYRECFLFYGGMKGLQLSYYSKNPIWYARVRDTNNDGEIDSISVQDENGRKTFITPEEETMLRNQFYRLSEERAGVLRQGVRIVKEKQNLVDDIRLERVDGKLLVKCYEYPSKISIIGESSGVHFNVYTGERIMKKLKQGYLEIDMDKVGLRQEDTYYLEIVELRRWSNFDPKWNRPGRTINRKEIKISEK